MRKPDVCAWQSNVAIRSVLASGYFHVSLRMGSCLRQLDVNVIAQADDEAEQPVGGKSIEAASEQVGNLGLPDSEQLGGVAACVSLRRWTIRRISAASSDFAIYSSASSMPKSAKTLPLLSWKVVSSLMVS